MEKIRTATESVVQTVISTTLENFTKTAKQNIKQAVTGVAAPQPSAPAAEADFDEAPPPAELASPEDEMPWTTNELESTWADGRKMRFPRNKKTGNVDLMGVVFENPFIAEKGMDLVNTLGETVIEGAKKFAQSGLDGVKVVKHVPENAIDAGSSESKPEAASAEQKSNGWPGDI